MRNYEIKAKSHFSCVAMTLVVASLASTAAAQKSNASGEASESPAVLEEVIVSGDLIQRQLIDNASSIAVYDENAMESAALRDLSDLLLRVPNVTSSRPDKFSLRGISNQLTGRSRTLANVFIDGVRQQGRGVAHTFDVEQVEIYRGPQSTSFGPSSLAGAIYVKTADPSEEWTARARVGYGSFDTSQLGLSLSGPLTDTLGVRLTTDQNKTDGDIKNTTLDIDDWQRRKRRLERLKLSWDPGEVGGYSAMVTVQHSEVNAGSELLTPETASDGEATDNVDAFDDDSSYVYGLTQDLEILDWLSLQSITSSSSNEQNRLSDGDIGPEDTGSVLVASDYDNIAQEFRLRINSSYTNAVLGVYASKLKQESESFNDDIVFPAGGGLNLLLDGTTLLKRDVDTRAVFAEADFFPWDWLTTTVGLRYEENEQTTTTGLDVIEAYALHPVLGIPVADVTQIAAGALNQFEKIDSDGDVILPKLALTFHLADGFNVLFSHTQGYRAGGAEVSGEGEVVPFDAEKTYNYDLGFRVQKEKFRLNAGLFYVDWRDQQVRQRLTTTTLLTLNSGRSEIKGAELEGSYQFSSRLGLEFGAGYVESRFKDFDSSSGDFSGNEFPYAPHYNYSLGLNYRHENGWFTNLSYSYSDGAYTDNENREELRADSYGLLNGRLGYSGENYSVYLYGQNLLDDFYVTDHFLNESLGFEGLVIGDPREVGIVIDVSF